MAHPRGKGKETKNITCLYLEPKQSMKLTRELELISTSTLDDFENFKIYFLSVKNCNTLINEDYERINF